jgi:hypothetical protein
MKSILEGVGQSGGGWITMLSVKSTVVSSSMGGCLGGAGNGLQARERRKWHAKARVMARPRRRVAQALGVGIDMCLQKGRQDRKKFH